MPPKINSKDQLGAYNWNGKLHYALGGAYIGVTPIIETLQYYSSLASFPGPAQLSVACSAEKRGEPGIYSTEVRFKTLI